MEALTTYALIAAAFAFGSALVARAFLGIKRSWRSTQSISSPTASNTGE